MIDLSKKKLLDKLYSYRGENSPILNSVDEERRDAISKRDNSLITISDLEASISVLKDQENLFLSKGEVLKNNLELFINDEDIYILTSLDISFNPKTVKEEIEERLPKTILEIQAKTKEASEKLIEEKASLEEALIKIEELGIRHDEIVSNQLRLNHYFELALSGDANFTREEITSLLKYFNLEDKEILNAAKILMFPEDDLYDYDNDSKESPSVKVQPVEFAKQKQEEVSAPVIEPVVSEEILSETTEATIAEDSKEDSDINPEPTTKEYLIEYLKSNNIDYLDFTSNDFDKILNNFDRELYTKNISLLNELKFDKDILSDCSELFYDKDLKAKIDLLIDNGKEASDINLNPSILTKYDLKGLTEAISALKDSGLDPKCVPLMAY